MVKHLLLPFFVSILLFGCSTQKDFIAEHDYSYKGAFNKYKTYNFMREYGVDSSTFNPIVEKTIVSRLNAQGFRLNEKNPDMLITYKLYFAKLKYHGYDQPNFDLWLNKNGVPIVGYETDTLVSGKLRQMYQTKDVAIDDGMMLVLVVDRKKSETVWQGYTSGLAGYNDPSLNINIVRATSKVMDQFRIVVRDFLIN